MFLIRWRRSSFDFSEYGRIPWFPLFPPLPGIWRTSRSDGSHRSWGICRGHRRGQGTWRISVWRLDHDFCSTSEMLLIPGAITLSLPSRHRNLSPMSFLFSFPVNGGICDPSSLPGAGGNFSSGDSWSTFLLMDLLVFWKICWWICWDPTMDLLDGFVDSRRIPMKRRRFQPLPSWPLWRVDF